MKKYFYFLIYFLVLIIHSNANDCEITIFDVGQGNCVLVKYGQQAIMVDAGSNELRSSHFYDSLYRVDRAKYLLTSKQVSTIDYDTEDSIDCDYDDYNSQGVRTDPRKVKYQNDYKIKKIQSIREKISPTPGQITLKTLIISHPDEDHYNWVPEIFSKDCDFQIGTVILGGVREDYRTNKKISEDSFSIQDWLNAYTSNKKINKYIFAGWHNGDNDEEGYARSYCSKIPDKERTDTEEAIQQSLIFSSLSTNPAPIIEILSMNAGHSVNPLNNSIYIANPDTNTNSIVLRIKHKDSSFLIPGDANAGTWNHILSSYTYNELKTDYFLLSHHGALMDEANSPMVLSILNPSACFISAGRRKGYNHPRGEVIDNVKDYVGSFSSKDDYHYISYYRSKLIERNKEQISYIRQLTKYYIYATQDKGTLSFKLAPKIDVEYTRDRNSSLHARFVEIEVIKKFSRRADLAELENEYKTRVFILPASHNPTSTDKELTLVNGEPFDTVKDFYILIDEKEKTIKKIELQNIEK